MLVKQEIRLSDESKIWVLHEGLVQNYINKPD